MKLQLYAKKTFCSRNINELTVAHQSQDIVYYTLEFQQQVLFCEVSSLREASVTLLCRADPRRKRQPLWLGSHAFLGHDRCLQQGRPSSLAPHQQRDFREVFLKRPLLLLWEMKIKVYGWLYLRVHSSHFGRCLFVVCLPECTS